MGSEYIERRGVRWYRWLKCAGGVVVATIVTAWYVSSGKENRVKVNKGVTASNSPFSERKRA